MSFLKRSFSKRKPEPINLSQADQQESDAFFDALLKSCAIPPTPARTSLSGYESTPEPIGHPEPPGLHRHVSTRAIYAAPESKYYRTSDGLERKLLKPPQAAGAERWPTRSSSIKGSQQYDSNYQHLIHNDQRRKHPPSSLASVETNEEPYIEDGYDQYSEQRHEVLRNHGFWQRFGRDDGEPLHRPRRNAEDVEETRRPRQNYDRRTSSLRREDATLGTQNSHSSLHGPSATVKPDNSFDLRRSVLFEPHAPPQPAIQSLSDFAVATPSTIGLVPRPLFSPDQLPSTWSHSESEADSDSTFEFSPAFENTSIFRPWGGAADDTPLTPLSPWPHTDTTERPAFKDAKLEEYRLADPELLLNIGQPLPQTPYLHLSWDTVNKDEYLLALGHHALCQRLQLPPTYAARPNIGKAWADEEGVEVEVEKFNGKVEEMCKVELQTIERMNERDGRLRKEFGLDEVSNSTLCGGEAGLFACHADGRHPVHYHGEAEDAIGGGCGGKDGDVGKTGAEGGRVECLVEKRRS